MPAGLNSDLNAKKKPSHVVGIVPYCTSVYHHMAAVSFKKVEAIIAR